MKTFAKLSLFSLFLAWLVILNIYHLGVYPAPKVDLNEKAEGQWFDRREFGINNMVLIGPPFARGRLSGQWIGPLLQQQEESLISLLSSWLPSRVLVQGVVLGAITWFQGIDKFLDHDSVQEMYGTSFAAPHQFDYLADGFTRQVAYHGLHEVGQMMVDQGFEDMGCTVAAVQYKNSFVVGRNFDFEGGRIFDSEKIVKWVFPDHGYAFVSVIWAGMVGAVTGVNEKGLYISLNAAGSSEKRRIGTPSTLVLLNVLEHAATGEEALRILRETPMLITDNFALLTPEGRLYRIEKSPERTQVIELTKSSIITNHLIAPEFAADATNQFRMNELTSVIREQRGVELLKNLPVADSSHAAVLQVLSVLRDKGVDENGQVLNLGNRRAIDALIATHSVIYDPFARIFYVSQGPAASGPYQGYDLPASFQQRRPVKVESLPADPLVSTDTFKAVKDSHQVIHRAHRLILRTKKCAEAKTLLEQVPEVWRAQAEFYHAWGDLQACQNDRAGAKVSWAKALSFHPAYRREVRQLEEKLK